MKYRINGKTLANDTKTFLFVTSALTAFIGLYFALPIWVIESEFPLWAQVLSCLPWIVLVGAFLFMIFWERYVEPSDD